MASEQDVPNGAAPEQRPSARPRGNVQDEFLNELRTSQALVKVLLTCGRELTGHIKAFDAFTILLQCANADVLMYKSGLAALGPVSEPPDSPPA